MRPCVKWFLSVAFARFNRIYGDECTVFIRHVSRTYPWANLSVSKHFSSLNVKTKIERQNSAQPSNWTAKPIVQFNQRHLTDLRQT